MLSKVCFPVIIIFIFSVFYSCADKKEQHNVNGNKEEVAYMNNIRGYLIDAATAITDSSMQNIKSLADWESVRTTRYQEFLEMMGIDKLMAEKERSDLNVKITR